MRRPDGSWNAPPPAYPPIRYVKSGVEEGEMKGGERGGLQGKERKKKK